MKKHLIPALSLSLCLGLAACSGGGTTTPSAPPAPSSSPVPSESAAVETSAAESATIHVFAAASLTEALTQIGENYKAVAPNITVTFTFDSSGILQKQIEQGAECDLFLSAAQKQMNALFDEKYIDESTRTDLLENKVVLTVPEGNPAGVTAFEDVNTDKVKLVALGNSDVPVGQYAEELYTTLGIWDDIQSKITFGSNVKEVTTWVSEGTVDCGVVYATDAHSAGLQVVSEADPALLSNKVVYPAAVLSASAHADAAKAFLDYLTSADSVAVFQSVGFAMAS